MFPCEVSARQGQIMTVAVFCVGLGALSVVRSVLLNPAEPTNFGAEIPEGISLFDRGITE